MNWFSKFLTSSIGQKVIMSITGLFLILFLVIHLIGNLQLLKNDGGESFNIYAAFMAHNPLMKVVSITLYASILLHAIQGILITLKNKGARKQKYQVANTQTTSFASRQMALLGTLIFVFICIHMGDFWYKMKFTDELPLQKYATHTEYVKDLYSRVYIAFQQLWIVVVYVISMVVLTFHLLHGFQSAFQTLGLNHRKYTPVIKAIGTVFAILVPLAFALIPVLMYFN